MIIVVHVILIEFEFDSAINDYVVIKIGIC